MLLELVEDEDEILPVAVHLLELDLHLLLLHRTRGALLDVLEVLQDAALDHVPELEGILSHVQLRAGDFLEPGPVPGPHGGRREHLDQWEHLEEVVNLLP